MCIGGWMDLKNGQSLRLYGLIGIQTNAVAFVYCLQNIHAQPFLKKGPGDFDPGHSEMSYFTTSFTPSIRRMVTSRPLGMVTEGSSAMAVHC